MRARTITVKITAAQFDALAHAVALAEAEYELGEGELYPGHAATLRALDNIWQKINTEWHRRARNAAAAPTTGRRLRGYRAEDHVFADTRYRPFRNIDGPSLGEARRLIEHECTRHGLEPPHVRRTRGRNGWHWHAGSISIPQRAGLSLVLHELAHFLAYTLDDYAGHGRPWARRYIELVQAHIGAGYARRLRAAFEREGLKVAS